MKCLRSGQRTHRIACAFALLWLCGCGLQAADDYRGEPLLRMRGQATVSALTGGQAIDPALCFVGADKPNPPAFDLNKLPEHVRQDVSLVGQFDTLALDKSATHILDVESRGEFPAQFDVEVYLPPTAAALSDGFFEGEPRWASGHVCAVARDHAAVTFPLAVRGGALIQDAFDGWHESFVLASQDTPRFYFESTHCSDSAGVDCEKTSEGDASLRYETVSESVLGVARDLDIIYLAEPAPASSFMAWSLGADYGLSAGYHLYGPPSQEAVDQLIACSNANWEDALAEIKAKYEARIKEEFGDFQVLDMFPLINTPDGSGVMEVPEDVARGGTAIMQRLDWERCPSMPRSPIDANLPTLSIEIAGEDISTLLGSRLP